MLLPGARMSVMLLRLKPEKPSDFVVELTAVAFLTHAGSLMPVVLPELPAATTTEMFFTTASSMGLLKSEVPSHQEPDTPTLPKLTLMTDMLNLVELEMHQSKPVV